MTDGEKRVPDWLVERFAAGDLPPRQAAEVQQRLERSGALGRIAELERSNRTLLAEHPPARVIAEVKRRETAERRNTAKRGETAEHGDTEKRRSAGARTGGQWMLPAFALAGVASLIVAFVSVGPLAPTPSANRQDETAPETVTAKGLEPHLVVYKQTPAGPARLKHPSTVRPGDTLQLAYVAAGARHGVVASVDDRGTVTLHLPEQEGPAAALAERGETALPHAFELDQAPGFERFVFVWSPSPFAAADVLGALRAGAAPRGLRYSELLVNKEVR